MFFLCEFGIATQVLMIVILEIAENDLSLLHIESAYVNPTVPQNSFMFIQAKWYKNYRQKILSNYQVRRRLLLFFYFANIQLVCQSLICFLFCSHVARRSMNLIPSSFYFPLSEMRSAKTHRKASGASFLNLFPVLSSFKCFSLTSLRNC